MLLICLPATVTIIRGTIKKGSIDVFLSLFHVIFQHYCQANVLTELTIKIQFPAPAPPPQKVCNSLSFKDIFTKIGGQLSLSLSHRLAKTKFQSCVCVSARWYIYSLKNGKVKYFTKFSRYLCQNWWTSSS